MHFILKRFFLFFCFFIINIDAVAMEKPIPIGNFSLPPSQRPGALYSFGSNIIDPGQIIGRITPNLFQTTTRRYIGSGLAMLYGSSSNTSLLFTLPITPSTSGPKDIQRHAGFGDVGLQGEYALYQHSSLTDSETGALLGGFTVPSGTKNFGYDTFSYFIGGTYSHVWSDWIIFTAPGLLQFSGGDPKKRLASRAYYEVGVAHNISSQTGEYIFTGFLEINGQYDNKNPSPMPVTRDSGGRVLSDGNLLFLSPSLFFSTQKWILALGVSWPITQHWLGTRDQVDYFIGASIGYRFN